MCNLKVSPPNFKEGLFLFHCCDNSLWYDVRSILAAIAKAYIEKTQPRLNSSQLECILPFIEQMDYLYLHPRRDAFFARLSSPAASGTNRVLPLSR